MSDDDKILWRKIKVGRKQEVLGPRWEQESAIFNREIRKHLTRR